MVATVGIVVAKENSNRFPGKNVHPLDGRPLFWHSVAPLLASENIGDVYVATNSRVILDYCSERNVKTIFRNRNVTHDDEPLLSVLKFVYQSIDISYDCLATIMANCPGHTVENVDLAIGLMEAGSYNEVRGFNGSGEESGLIVFKTSVILNYVQISSHVGCVRTEGQEVHYREELEKLDK